MPSKWTFLYLLMSAHHNLRSCSLLKTVLNKLGYSYQTYVNTYKTHTMATCHRGTEQPLDRDTTAHGHDTDIHSNYHHDEKDNFENVEHENHTTLKTLTRDLDDLWHRVETAEGQLMEAINHLKCELHRLSLALHSSAPPEPLDDVLQQYHGDLMFCHKVDHFCKYANPGHTHLQW